MTQYFLIRDAADEGHVIAIHRVWDSANACFSKFIKDENYVRYIELIGIFTDQFGIVKNNLLIYTYSKSSKVLVRHYQKDASGEVIVL